MLKNIIAPIDEVAPALGMSVPTLKRRLKDMHDKHGFPLPLPGDKWRWSRSAVTSWITAAGSAAGQVVEQDADEAEQEGPSEALGSAIVLDMHRTLHERYVGGK